MLPAADFMHQLPNLLTVNRWVAEDLNLMGGKPEMTDLRQRKETPMATETKKLSPNGQEQLLKILKTRFEKNTNRHKGVAWSDVRSKLTAATGAGKLWTLNEMEKTGGEPDVVNYEKKTGEYIFYDCSAETPSGRRSVCYDREGWLSRKEHRPQNNAVDMAAAMGIELLTEEQYRSLNMLGTFDSKTSTWLNTPADIRKLGGAIFADFRYGQVFVYHNGAQSYYSGRGFRGLLRV